MTKCKIVHQELILVHRSYSSVISIATMLIIHIFFDIFAFFSNIRTGKFFNHLFNKQFFSLY